VPLVLTKFFPRGLGGRVGLVKVCSSPASYVNLMDKRCSANILLVLTTVAVLPAYQPRSRPTRSRRLSWPELSPCSCVAMMM